MPELHSILPENEIGFKALFDNATIAILIVNRNREIMAINPFAENVFGYQTNELKGTLMEILVPQNLRESHVQQHAEYYANPATRLMAHGEEVYGRKKDGTLFPVLVNLCYYHWDGDMRVVAFVTDVTERRKAEEKNVSSERKIRLLIEHTPAAIAMLDTNMNYIVVSRRWFDDYRLTDKNITGRCHYDVFPGIPDKWKDLHKRCLSGQIVRSSDEEVFRREDGTKEWLRWELCPWYNEHNEIGGLIIFSEIITERKIAEEKFFKLFHKSPVAIVLTESVTRKVIDANESFCSLFGYSREELMGRTSLEAGIIFLPSERQTIAELIDANNHLYNYEVALRGKRKEVLHVSLSVETIEISGKKYYLSTCIDITEKKKAEETLKQNEERFRLIFNSIDEGFMLQEIIKDEAGVVKDLLFLEINHATERILNKSRNEIVGHFRTEIFGPMDEELREIISLVENDENIRREEFIPSLNKWFDRSFYSPRPGTLITINTDITESKREEQLHAFLVEAGNRLWLIDNFNEGLEEILSVSIELMGADKGSMQLFDAEKKALVIASHKGFDRNSLALFKKAAAGIDSAYGYALRTKSQINIQDTETDPLFESFRQISKKSDFRAVQSTPMYSNDGTLLGVISTYFKKPYHFDTKRLRSIELYARKAESFIERFKMYAALQKMNAELEEKVRDRTKQLIGSLEHEKELNEIKSRFISIASHEFRTPLSVILSSTYFVESYNKDGQEEKRRKHIGRIKESVKNLTALLEDFLSIEKLEQGKIEIAKTDFDMQALCEDIIGEMTGMLKTGQHITLAYTGEKKVVQDKKILRNIILNLLSNAIKYSEENKTIWFSAKVNSNLKILVKDEGIGIPENEQKNIFGKFSRASNANGIQGTGLGLNIVKKYVELLNGNIHFFSKYNEGTTFTVELPR
ncbi:MAG TPA: PAS domain S-box protein [Puia sp.]|nr:PAS domain S-box protein [Puia sp.]